jgi:hypothetical protein
MSPPVVRLTLPATRLSALLACCAVLPATCGRVPDTASTPAPAVAAPAIVQPGPELAQRLGQVDLYERQGRQRKAEAVRERILAQHVEEFCRLKNRALRLVPHDPSLRTADRGRAYEQTVRILRRCVALDPRDAGAHFEIATHLSAGGATSCGPAANPRPGPDAAMAELKIALDLDPGNCDALTYMNLFSRLEAQVAMESARKTRLLGQAAAYRKRAIECKIEKLQRGAVASQ